jgi:CDP-glucose 4,6-dehydratase
MTASHWRGHRVLVTGAGGFVGSWVTKHLLDRGADVTVILRDSPAVSNFSLLSLEGRVNVVWGSISDLPLVQRTVNEYEIATCFHLAAQAIVSHTNASPLSTFESNIRGTWTVLEACRLSGRRVGVVVASSDKAYGYQEQLPYREDTPLLGNNPYDASKACTDILSVCYSHSYDMPLAIARCANIYGGGDLNFSRLIPGSFQSALRGEAPVIRSDGSPLRDYIFADDAVAAYLTLGERLGDTGVCGTAFNFGTGSPLSVMDLVKQILHTCGTEVEPIVAGDPLPGEIEAQSLDSRRAETVLGWRPDISLGEGLERTKEWYQRFLKEHPVAEAEPDHVRS